MKSGLIRSPKRSRDLLLNSAIYIFLFIIIMIIVFMEPGFLSINNFSMILTQASTRLIFALGVGSIIILGGTDLSLGRSVGMTAVVSATLLQATDYGSRVFPNLPRLPLIVPIVLVMLLSGVFSLLHGLLVAKLKIAPFIASMGMEQIIYGISTLYYNQIANMTPVGSLDPAFTKMVQGAIVLGRARFNYIILYAIGVVAIVWFIWNKTKLGKNMYAIGGNIEAAKVSGVNIVVSTIAVYFIAGLLYGFGGALESARTGSATSTLGASYALDGIAACVVGGVSMRGGIGTVSGVIIGVLLFQVINYGLVFVGVSPDVQYVVKGVVILLAVAIDTQKYIANS